MAVSSALVRVLGTALSSGLMARSRISTGEGGGGDGAHDGISYQACFLLWLDGKVEIVMMIMMAR